MQKLAVDPRREVEARILVPLIEAFSNEFGNKKVLELVRSGIVQIATDQGAELAQQVGGNSLAYFAESLRFWTRITLWRSILLSKASRNFIFNVTRCRYAELYEKLGFATWGSLFSCTRDFALIKGFNHHINLKRTRTIMEGAAYCDFCYTIKKGS